MFNVNDTTATPEEWATYDRSLLTFNDLARLWTGRVNDAASLDARA